VYLTLFAGLVFNPETSACDQPENVPGCEDTYVKNKPFKRDPSQPLHEESRSSGGKTAAADISSGEFSGFLALLKENGLLKPGALKALNAAMEDSASSKPGLIHRDSRLTDGRSLGGGAESEERTLVVDDEEEEEEESMEEKEQQAQPPAAVAKTSRLQTLFARRAQQNNAGAAASTSSTTVLPLLKSKVNSATTEAAIAPAAIDEEVKEPDVPRKKKKKVVGGTGGPKLLLKEEEMGKVMAAVLQQSEDETMKKIVKAILGTGKRRYFENDFLYCFYVLINLVSNNLFTMNTQLYAGTENTSRIPYNVLFKPF
jgi:hypothetical protein